ncbi:asparagine synthase (glutamine-hydrolyzing) [Alphaproteobacteria bacterium]|nr:asparagine synthase (glutamine-hydrolyzing) [Alphaproteobacteria bacterium]
MCGILGYYGCNPNSVTRAKFLNALEQSNFRGPDFSASSEIRFNDSQILLGHNRLSILDLSSNGNQPMVSQSRQSKIIFNGEIYNHLSLRKKYLPNFNWKSTCDTETLLEIAEKFTVERILNDLIGMFSFCIYNENEKIFTFVRDRIGEKPLYIHTDNNKLIFSSDLSSIVPLTNNGLKICNLAVRELLKHNYIPTPLSIYENTFKLPPSTVLKIDLNKYQLTKYKNYRELINSKGVNIHNYWKFQKINLKNYKDINYNDTKKNLKQTLIKAVTSQTISDVPIGTFFSGGIDSSLIVSILNEHTNSNRIKTFNIGFDFEDYDESSHAKKISKYLGTDHTNYMFNKNETIDFVQAIPKAYSEPFADSSQIPTMLISKIASKDVKVVLSGDAGDELFGGYNRYLLANKYWNKLNLLPQLVRKFIIELTKLLPKKIISKFLKLIFSENLSGSYEIKIEKILRKLKTIHDEYSFYKSFTTEWRDEDNIYKFENEKFDHISKNEFDKFCDFSFEEAMMNADQKSYLPDDILCKVDRASMFYSLETRVPFLDKNVIELANSLPLNFKIHKGKTKRILRDILSDYIPEQLFDRPKQGFSIPLGLWMKNELLDWTESMLDTSIINKHNLFDSNVIKKTWEDHKKNKNDNFYKLWSIIQFNHWYKFNFLKQE